MSFHGGPSGLRVPRRKAKGELLQGPSVQLFVVDNLKGELPQGPREGELLQGPSVLPIPKRKAKGELLQGYGTLFLIAENLKCEHL